MNGTERHENKGSSEREMSCDVTHVWKSKMLISWSRVEQLLPESRRGRKKGRVAA